MAWVKGVVHGEVREGGEIVAATRDLVVMETAKPATPEEARSIGMDLAALEQLMWRNLGDFEFEVHFGGATALLAPFSALTRLDDRRMERLCAKYFGGGQFPEWVAIMHVRNTGAPAQWNCAEPSGGMAETVDLLAEQVGEIGEMGVVHKEGWVRFLLLGHLLAHQGAFEEEQRAAWQLVEAECVSYKSATLELLPIGRDSLNGQAGIVTAGPVGDVALTCVAKLYLDGTGYRFLDLETHKGNPMRRRMVAIAPRPGKSPVVLALNAQGELDDFGLHFVLDGENRDLAVTNIGKAVLQALGWMP